MLLSLFCGAGGLDIGFERAGYEVQLAYDKRPPAVRSYNANRPSTRVARVRDISTLTLAELDADAGTEFRPTGVIGGPPCQSFTKANAGRSLSDPRAALVSSYVSIALELHSRSSLDFMVMENVPELERADNGRLLGRECQRLSDRGFEVTVHTLNSADFGVPQNRKRMFLVALRQAHYKSGWQVPLPSVDKARNVASALLGLPEPVHFSRNAQPSEYHPNHWCMAPKSRRFFDGSLRPGYSAGRSFKTLHWDRPSIAVSYGNREVHIHPDGRRRLSVLEAMLLQGFPFEYELHGTLSDQISQVSEAVPPPLAYAVAKSIRQQDVRYDSANAA